MLLLVGCSSSKASPPTLECPAHVGRYVVHREQQTGTCAPQADETVEADVFTADSSCAKHDVDVQGCDVLYWYACAGDTTRTGSLRWHGDTAKGLEVRTGACEAGYLVTVTHE